MEAFNWQALQAISETLGLIVVVSSLVFVGFQVRQSDESGNHEQHYGFMGRGLSGLQ